MLLTGPFVLKLPAAYSFPELKITENLSLQLSSILGSQLQGRGL